MNNDDFLPNRTRVELSFEKPFQWNYETQLSTLQNVNNSFDPTQQDFHDSVEYSGSIFKGWFVAPATTNYRFLQACHGECSLWLSTTPDDDTSPTNIIEKHTIKSNDKSKIIRMTEHVVDSRRFYS